MVFLLLWGICGVIGAAIGSERGHGAALGFICGFFLGPIGLLILALTRGNQTQQSQPQQRQVNVIRPQERPRPSERQRRAPHGRNFLSREAFQPRRHLPHLCTRCWPTSASLATADGRTPNSHPSVKGVKVGLAVARCRDYCSLCVDHYGCGYAKEANAGKQRATSRIRRRDTRDARTAISINAVCRCSARPPSTPVVPIIPVVQTSPEPNESSEIILEPERQPPSKLPPPEFRTWTDKKGKTIEVSGGHVLGQCRILTRNGKILTIPHDQFSEEDQQWIRNRESRLQKEDV